MASESQLLSQLLLTGVPGFELDAATAARLKKLQPGGYILFGRNIQSAQQVRKLIDDLRDLSEIEPIITIDQEGGRVSRLRLIGEEPPNAQALLMPGGLWHAIHAVPMLEAEFGRPVLLNILSTTWAALHAAGKRMLHRPDPRWGKVLASL